MGFADYELLKKNLIRSSKIIQTEIPNIEKEIEKELKNQISLEKEIKNLVVDKKTIEKKINTYKKDIEKTEKSLKNQNSKILDAKNDIETLNEEISEIQKENSSILNYPKRDVHWLNRNIKKVKKIHSQKFDRGMINLTIKYSLLWAVMFTFFGVYASNTYGQPDIELGMKLFLNLFAAFVCFILPLILMFGLINYNIKMNRKLRLELEPLSKQNIEYNENRGKVVPIKKIISNKVSMVKRRTDKLHELQNRDTELLYKINELNKIETELIDSNNSINTKKLQI